MRLMEDRPEVEELHNAELSEESPTNEVVETEEKVKGEAPSLWQRLRRFFFPSYQERREAERQRLIDLAVAIERYPEAAVNYLLRGELHLELAQYELAKEDFEQALQLAEAQYPQERWGLSAQAISDRARRGLETVLRYS
jgi:tetratricopeptide (TPR) repeat protein